MAKLSNEPIVAATNSLKYSSGLKDSQSIDDDCRSAYAEATLAATRPLQQYCKHSITSHRDDPSGPRVFYSCHMETIYHKTETH